ncbi:MAG: hypothetical protein MSIBF_05030 [Candidatus Altiarchaeales archaeon IMC4]|nr:MAG: hypothetical protein MSIBF_05030 [Candidatus Altiarchaeales archaeon IMC4]
MNEPRFEIDENWFGIIFNRAHPSNAGLRESYEKTREKTREKLIQLIKEDPKITTEELSKKTGLSIKGIEWNIKKLKDEKILERIGHAKGGRWEIVITKK